jgi:hypothetical protein
MTHNTVIYFLDFICGPVFIWNNFGDWNLSLPSDKKPTQLGPNDRASLYLQTVVWCALYRQQYTDVQADDYDWIW